MNLLRKKLRLNYLLVLVGILIFLILVFEFTNTFIINQFLHNSPKNKLKVLSTNSIINDLVKNIGGKYINSKSLIKPGVDPHKYQISKMDMIKLRESDVIFYNGLFLEIKLTDILIELEKVKPVYSISELIETSELLSYSSKYGNEEITIRYDSHIWLDLKLWQNSATLVKTKLVKLIPEKKKEITENYKKMINILSELDKFIIEKSSNIPSQKRIIVTHHDAFSYFGRRYGFRVESLNGITTIPQVGENKILQMVSLIKQNQYPIFFYDSLANKKYLDIVKQNLIKQNEYIVIGGILYSDSLGKPGSEADTFVDMVIHNILTIEEGLNSNTK